MQSTAADMWRGIAGRIVVRACLIHTDSLEVDRFAAHCFEQPVSLRLLRHSQRHRCRDADPRASHAALSST